MTPDEAARARRRMRQQIGKLARSGARIAGAGLDAVASGARRIGDTSAERLRERRRRQLAADARSNRTPLPSLFDLHPEARRYMRREIGLRSVPVEEIAGTAVAGPAQRGSDFQPLPAFKTANWEARWQRIRRAVDQLTILPPIDVLWFADRYWVEDGHNRVAAALANGQVEIDAAVAELRPPNARVGTRSEALAPVLDLSHELRAAGEGRFSVSAAGHLATSADEADEHDAAVDDDTQVIATARIAAARAGVRPIAAADAGEAANEVAPDDGDRTVAAAHGRDDGSPDREVGPPDAPGDAEPPADTERGGPA